MLVRKNTDLILKNFQKILISGHNLSNIVCFRNTWRIIIFLGACWQKTANSALLSRFWNLVRYRHPNQCCGSLTLWYGSGSGDPYLWLIDSDPAIFVSDLQDGNNKKILFFGFLLFEAILTSVFKEKVIKRHKTVGIKVFLIIFAWW
jgi:hypothetical protein